jgi:hypothetical protein
VPLYNNWATWDPAPVGHGLYVLEVKKWPWLKQPAYTHAISRKIGIVFFTYIQLHFTLLQDEDTSITPENWVSKETEEEIPNIKERTF